MKERRLFLHISRFYALLLYLCVDVSKQNEQKKQQTGLQLQIF